MRPQGPKVLLAALVLSCLLVAAGGCAGELAWVGQQPGIDAGPEDSGDGEPDGGGEEDAGGEPDPDPEPEPEPADGGDGGGTVEDDAGMNPDTPDAGPTRTPFVYVGSGNGNVRPYTLNRTTGALSLQGTSSGGTNPSWLDLHPTLPFVYGVNEGSPGQVSAFSVNLSNGALTSLGQVSSQGNGPAHLSVDKSGKWVLVANYGGGNVAVLPILADGKLGAATDTKAPGANAHQILTDPQNKFAFVPCKGANLIAQYVFDSVNGKLTANAVPTVATAAGAGPRHLAFHPTAPYAYGINELASTLNVYAYDSTTGRLTAVGAPVSTLPQGFAGTNTGAEVAVHPSGKFLYASNRGHQSIAVFAIDASNGTLTLVEHEPTGGNTPRSFALDPAGGLLYVANQDSGTVHGFRIDSTTGALTSLGEVAQANAPAFVGVFLLPPP